MTTQKTTFKWIVKVTFFTLLITFLLSFLIFLWFIIKVSFFNGFEFKTNLYWFKTWVQYYFDHQTKNKKTCDNLTQNDVDLLNLKFQNLWYFWTKSDWCDLETLSLRTDYDENEIIIPEEIFKLQNLYYLHLVSPNLNKLDFKNIVNLTNLVNLSLSSNTWSLQIPNEIYNLKTLKYLTIWWKWFNWTLSQDIKNLDKLKTLTILNTNIWWEFPLEIFDLKDFRELILLTNKFIWDAQKLKQKLDLLESYKISKNSFSWEFPWYISELKSFK